MTEMDQRVIIIPDLHGREFWREAVGELPADARVVFLGDYLDPYENEWIFWTDAFKSLQDIIALKKTYAEQVTLLWGNHDLHYMFPSLQGSRFNDSHAGVHSEWLKKHSSLFGTADEITAETFNRLMFTDEFVEALSDVSALRGGWSRVGSMIWADIDEFAGTKVNESEMYQVFGHTKCSDGQPKVYGNVICLDCQKAFLLSEKGIVGF